MENIGIIGYGAMGAAYAERLRDDAGIRPLVYDIDSEAQRRAKDSGFELASSAAELPKASDIIDVIVLTDDQTIEATTGPKGALEGAKPGAFLLLHSNNLPKTTFEVADAAKATGVKVADAPSSGSPTNVRANKMVFLLGADPDLAEAVQPHLLRLAREVVHIGPLGAGNVARMMRTLLNASERLLLWEALQMGEAGGISYRDGLEMFRTTVTGRLPLQERWEEAWDTERDDPLPVTGLNTYHKDVPQIIELAHFYGLELPVLEQIGATAAVFVKLNEGRPAQLVDNNNR